MYGLALLYSLVCSLLALYSIKGHLSSLPPQGFLALSSSASFRGFLSKLGELRKQLEAWELGLGDTWDEVMYFSAPPPTHPEGEGCKWQRNGLHPGFH